MAHQLYFCDAILDEKCILQGNYRCASLCMMRVQFCKADGFNDMPIIPFGPCSQCIFFFIVHYKKSTKLLAVADPECARGGGVSHILAEKSGVSFTLFKKMHENSIFSPITGGGGVRRVRPMLDPPLPCLSGLLESYTFTNNLFIYFLHRSQIVRKVIHCTIDIACKEVSLS